MSSRTILSDLTAAPEVLEYKGKVYKLTPLGTRQLEQFQRWLMGRPMQRLSENIDNLGADKISDKMFSKLYKEAEKEQEELQIAVMSGDEKVVGKYLNTLAAMQQYIYLTLSIAHPNISFDEVNELVDGVGLDELNEIVTDLNGLHDAPKGEEREADFPK